MRVAAIALLGLLGTQATAGPCVVDAPRMHLTWSDGDDAIFTEDMDRDGHEDLIVAGAIFYGRGDGTLEPVEVTRRYDAQVGDFTGDGLPDLVRNESGELLLSVNLGGRRFAAPTPVHKNVFIGAVADFTGDGYADLFAGTKTLINDGHGRFPLELVRETSLREKVFSAATGDVNGDGVLDLVVHTEGSLRVLLSDGKGGFVTSAKLDGWYRAQPLITDVNQDGKADVVTIINSDDSDSLVIYYGASLKTKVIILLTYQGHEAIAAGDYDRDGDIDLAVSWGEILWNIGNDRFSSEQAIRIGSGISVGSADFNDDGTTDLVLPFATVVLANGDGTFRLPAPFMQNDGYWIAEVVDLNGDGIDEMLTGVINLGGPMPVPTWPLQVAWMMPSGEYHSDTLFKTREQQIVAAGDVLAQPGKEVVAVDGSLLRIFSFAGPGQWSEAAAYDLHMQIDALALTDLTGDSRSEIAVVVTDATAQSSLRTFRGNGELQSITPLERSERFKLAALDADGDRSMDLVVAATGTIFNGPHYWGDPDGYLSLFRGGGHATLFFEELIVEGDEVQDILTGDFNGDGDADLIVGSYYGLHTLLGSGRGTFTSRESRIPNPHFAGDLNGDGISDVISSPGVTIHLGSPTGFIPIGTYFAESITSSAALVRRKPNASPAIVRPLAPYVTVIETRCQPPRPRRHSVRH